MKVAYTESSHQWANERLSNEHKFLTVGKSYVVLCVHISPDAGILVWLLDDKNVLIKQNILGFEVSSQRFPNNWAQRIHRLGGVMILPSRWIEPTFLTTLENGTAQNLDLFIEEAALTYEYEGMKFPLTKTDT